MIVQSKSVNGYTISAFSDKTHLVEYLNLSNYNGILVAINAEKILKDDSRLRELVNSNMGYTDGIGAVWALKKKGIESGKIAGAELWLEIIRQNYRTKTFYLIGSKQDIIESTVVKLKTEYPEINIVGFRDGYLNDVDVQNVTRDIIAKSPDVVFVAMGSPKQEYFMQDLLKHHKALYMGLGGSFDVFTGNLKRAPESWIRFNMEWAYRLVKQPQRVIRQIHLLRFVFRLIFNRL